MAIINFNNRIKPWIGIDLDGTLAEAKHNGEIGDPISSMVALVQNILDGGEFDVKIFTARADHDDGKEEVKAWLEKHKLPDLPVTCRKDRNTVLILDNIAARVKHNKGEICGECLNAINDRLSHQFSRNSRGFSAYFSQVVKADY